MHDSVTESTLFLQETNRQKKILKQKKSKGEHKITASVGAKERNTLD